MNKHVVIVIGAGLAFGCSPKEPVHENPGPPVDVQPPTQNPPPTNPPPALPAWDDVLSTHPEGATNPPHPILIVSPDGARCFKQFVGGMIQGPPDHVQACGADECGTEITCPQPRAMELLAASKAGETAPK